jgi:hypothetical protein
MYQDMLWNAIYIPYLSCIHLPVVILTILKFKEGNLACLILYARLFSITLADMRRRLRTNTRSASTMLAKTAF